MHHLKKGICRLIKNNEIKLKVNVEINICFFII